MPTVYFFQISKHCDRSDPIIKLTLSLLSHVPWHFQKEPPHSTVCLSLVLFFSSVHPCLPRHLCTTSAEWARRQIRFAAKSSMPDSPFSRTASPSLAWMAIEFGRAAHLFPAYWLSGRSQRPWKHSPNFKAKAQAGVLCGLIHHFLTKARRTRVTPSGLLGSRVRGPPAQSASFGDFPKPPVPPAALNGFIVTSRHGSERVPRVCQSQPAEPSQ